MNFFLYPWGKKKNSHLSTSHSWSTASSLNPRFSHILRSLHLWSMSLFFEKTVHLGPGKLKNRKQKPAYSPRMGVRGKLFSVF